MGRGTLRRRRAARVPRAAAISRREEFRGSRRRRLGIALLVGVADLVGVIAYSIGAREIPSIVLRGLARSSRVTAVVLPFGFLAEMLVANQYAGVALVAVGLLLLGLA